jgi:hypothetical protein
MKRREMTYLAVGLAERAMITLFSPTQHPLERLPIFDASLHFGSSLFLYETNNVLGAPTVLPRFVL